VVAILRYFRHFSSILFDPRVKFGKKFIFILLVSIYWILPDLLPFVPLDDLLFTLLSAAAFMKLANKDISIKNKRNKKEDLENVIDVEAKIIKDEKENDN
jgi:uncharacterized membrane protein